MQTVVRLCQQLKSLPAVSNLRRIAIRYLGWGLLYMGRPFTCVGNWFWKLHRKVLDWNN
jgi:hypothetical protein